LEWQFAEGGGQIIEDDRTISVNNPAAIRAWEQGQTLDWHDIATRRRRVPRTRFHERF